MEVPNIAVFHAEKWSGTIIQVSFLLWVENIYR